jgi:predicted nucleic acid-binding protein
MDLANGWFICRVGFVETSRAAGLAAGAAAVDALAGEWPSFAVVELDQRLAEDAAELASRRDLRSLDAIHLASALVLPRDELVVATWDKRLHAAAAAEDLATMPAELA